MKTPKSIHDYVELLEEGTPFTMANIGGDGEFLTITGWDGTNSDDRVSTPEKAEALSRVLLKPRLTFHGYNPGRLESQKLLDAETWLRIHGINIPNRSKGFKDPYYGAANINVRWVHKEIISSANVHGKLGGFITALRNRGTYVIGPDWLESSLLKILGANEALLLPLSVGWESLDDIEAKVRETLLRIPPETVVSWSLGYLTKVLMWRLAPDFPEFTQIDAGAIWDPYCGVLNRHGYRLPEWPEKMALNLQG